MSWWSRGNKDKSAGTYSQVRDSNGKLTNGFGKTENIPKMVLEGLNSQNEGLTIMRIANLAGENNYNKTDVCEHLIRLIQRDGRGKVVRLASEALVNVLSNIVNTDTVILLIKQGLFAKNAKTAELFIKMLDEPGCRIPLKKCAIEMLDGFTEGDVIPEAMDTLEAALFERYEDPKENDEVRNLIKHRFGPNRNGRPKVIVEHERPDETLLLDETTEAGKPREAKAAPVPEERATEALDVLSGWIEMLKHPDERRREIAAKSLMSMAEQTKDRKKVERIIGAFRERGAEFLSQFRKARDTLHGMGPDPENRHQRITMPPEPKRDSREPTEKQKLKR
jgi:hypothetical protein